MPAASSYGDWQHKDLREAAELEARQKLDHHALAWRYYEGEQTKPLKASSRVDNNVIINKIRPHADSTISFAAPTFPVLSLANNGQSRKDDPKETLMREMWAANRGKVWLGSAMLYGLLEGHVFVRLIEPDTESDYPRLVLLNPAKVITYWADDDFEVALWYEVRYRAGGEKRIQHIIAPQVVDNERWEVREYAMRDNHYSQAIGDPVQFDYPPIWDWQHLPHPGRYYGQHELHGMQIQDSINKVASDIKSILRLHAFPKLILFGVDKLPEMSADNLSAIPNEEARAQVLEMNSDLASSMNYLAYLDNAYMQQARVTLLGGGPDQYKGITNLGIKAAFMSQLEKTETLHGQYGDAIAELTKIMMAMMGQVIDKPKVTWANTLPESDLEKAQVQQMELSMGIQSKEGAARELGNDWGKVQEELADELPPQMQQLGLFVENDPSGTQQ